MIEKVAPYFGFNNECYGEGEDEIGVDRATKKTIIAVDSKYYRPAEVETLLGDSTKVKQKLGWEPKIDLEEGIQKTYDWYK